MKFIHLSDLHLGKRVNEFSMLEDQKHILSKILGIVRDEKPAAVLIAGDVYDKSVPSAEAVSIFDSFLCDLASCVDGLQIFLISGNHDSAERLAFGSRLMELSGVHIAPVYDGHPAVYDMSDEFGPLSVYLLPFVKPVNVRSTLSLEEDDPEDTSEISTYTDAMAAAIGAMSVDPTRRNLLVTHQFVTGAERSDSEEVSVGGTDNVDASVFNDFDYVALGHIHGPQNISQPGSPNGTDKPCLPVIRYCGSPLKYSFSETNHEKSVTVVEMEEKGNVSLRTVPLTPLRDMKEIKGQYNDLMARSYYEGTDLPNSYLHITLTDEMDVPEAMARLRVVYPYLMKLDYDNARTRAAFSQTLDAAPEDRSPLELFSIFFEKQNGSPMSEEQSAYIRSLLEDL